MPRPRKDGVRINIYCDREVVEMLDRYAEIKGQTKTVAVERILYAYLKDYLEENDTGERNPI